MNSALERAQRELTEALERMGENLPRPTWQKKYREKMLKTARGRYWDEIKNLATLKKQKEEELFELCLNAEEFDFCKEELEYWYHGKRLIAMRNFLQAEKRTIPTKEIIAKRREARND